MQRIVVLLQLWINSRFAFPRYFPNELLNPVHEHYFFLSFKSQGCVNHKNRSRNIGIERLILLTTLVSLNHFICSIQVINFYRYQRQILYQSQNSDIDPTLIYISNFHHHDLFFSAVDEIHSYPDVFLPGSTVPVGAPHSSSPQTEHSAGGRVGGKVRRSSLTSMDSQLSGCWESRLSSTVTNSEWAAGG